MRIVHYNDISAVDKKGWSDLLLGDPSHNIYNTYEWNRANAEIYGQPNKAFIVCVYDNDRLVAIFPLMFDASHSKRLLRFMGVYRSDYSDLICPESRNEIIPLINSYIFNNHNLWDEIRLEICPNTGAAFRFAEGVIKKFAYENARHESLSLRFNDDPKYTENVLTKKKVLAYRKALKAKEGYVVIHLTDPDLIKPHLDHFFAQHQTRWQSTLWPSLFHQDKNRDFYRRIIDLLPVGWITLSILKSKHEPIAYHLGYSYGKTFVWYKPTFDVTFAKFSPGQVLLQEVLEYAKAKGFEEFDFGIGKDAYKNRFGKTVRKSSSYRIYPNGLAYLFNYTAFAVWWRLRRFKI